MIMTGGQMPKAHPAEVAQASPPNFKNTHKIYS